MVASPRGLTDALLSVEFQRLKRCRYGYMLYNAHDVYIGRSFDLYGEFSEGEVELFRQIVKPGMVVLDVGANIGAHTVPLAQMARPGGMVLAFEPQRLIFQTLCANVAINALVNVDCRCLALGSQPGMTRNAAVDYTQPGNFGGLGVRTGHSGESVPLATIDGLNLPACDFLKVDVEGMEIEVLKGAASTISKYRPVLYVENDRADKSDELISYLLGLDYRLFGHLPAYFNPNNFFGRQENVFTSADGGHIVSFNMLCLPANAQWDAAGFPEIKRPEDWHLRPRSALR